MPPASSNPAKARRAAAHPDRPGEQCNATPGTYAVTIDRSRCEGKGDCVEVCPHGVFEVRTIKGADYAKLGVIGKLKSLAHGGKTAYTPGILNCQACGLCVVSCPEHALALVRRT